ncbi:hypothetical protein ACEXOS_005660 [Herbiconiux sp. P16]|uniref:hypothetical protein n=1 Tax=Herbiconiux wuyangfengii TaxID=3342794 RepID=UPI0035BAA496
MSVWPVWLGDLPAWITTITVIIAARQYIGERRKRRDEAEREARAQATRLAAWMVTDAPRNGAWGVRVLNTSGSTFHDVEIEAQKFGAPIRDLIELRIVPPGDLFVKLKPDGESWEYPMNAEECVRPLRPLARAERWTVTRMRFSDDRNQVWTTDDCAVLHSRPEGRPLSPSDRDQSEQ